MSDDSRSSAFTTLDPITIDEVVAFLIEKGPGRSARELAQAIYGPVGVAAQVHSACVHLEAAGKVIRTGAGVRGDPYRYYLVDG